MPDPEEWIVATKGAKTLPVRELLTGRGFVSGKSGSGKSNTVSVICEELLEANYTLLIVDTEGEYFGLKEEYQLLHVGGDDFAEVQVQPKHADKIAEIALEKNVPVILDVSGYDNPAVSEELITRVVDELYTREKRVRKPFLLVVEEMQEYLPQQGGSGELADLLERVAKRGRKRGLGMCGVSQRPSSVDKDYITQCDWMVWHKFTWESDLKVVSNVIGSDRAAEVEEFDPGEAYMMTDWDDTIERVTFRRKRTFDAGATPGLESFDRPDMRQVGEDFVSEIRGESAAGGSSGAAAAGTSEEPLDAAGTEIEDAGGLAEGDLAAPAASGEQEATDAEAPDADSRDTDSQDVDTPGVDSQAEGASEEESPVDDVNLDDLSELDDEALVEQVKRVRRENEMLKEEITDLRESIEAGGDDDGFPAASAGQAWPYGPREESSDGVDLEPPTRPEPPARQDVDNDAARVLFEFGDLMIYLWKLLVFYVLYGFYRVRVWLTRSPEGSNASGQQRGRPD